MEYQIVSSENEVGNEAGIEKIVAEEIKKGWEPIGNVTVLWRHRQHQDDIWTFFQAMIKRSLNPTERRTK